MTTTQPAAGSAAHPPARRPAFRATGAYPAARQEDVTDDYHGERVADPYRWLEEASSEQTTAWVQAQNELTESVLATVPSREEIRAQLTGRWDVPAFSVPCQRGGRWFAERNTGLQNQPVLHVMDAPDDEGRPLLDPNGLSADGTVAVVHTEVSPDGSMLAYATAEAGSDWLTWRVREVATGQDLPDTIRWSKSETAEWDAGGAGFYYTVMDPPQPGREYLDVSRESRVCYHRAGTSQEADPVIFAEDPDRFPHPVVTLTPGGRYLVVRLSRGLGPGDEFRVMDLHNPDTGFQVLVPAAAGEAEVIAAADDTFWVLTDIGAATRRIVAIHLAQPAQEHWREVAPAGEQTLLEAHFFGGRLVCHYLADACSVLRVLELDGTFVREIPMPGLSTLAGSQLTHEAISGTPSSDLMHFAAVSFTRSESLWSHDLRTGQTRLVRDSAAALSEDRYVTERVFVPSADGTRVPLFVTRRRDLPRDGTQPVLLYGYGGVGVCTTPAFKVPWAVWVERGGILAVASLRGGGEYGREWHEAGRLARKQNVFDDFCACARWLASSGWSRPSRVAINGASNGGLLAGVCLTQHPELFGAVISDVGVLDMLRFPYFTVGWAWTPEYGDPADSAEYAWLRAYSPLHHVAPAAYPATLLTTGDHDDRVVPGHSYKFTAALQAAQQAGAPVLLRVETAAGHGGGKPTAKAIAEATDRLAFLEGALGLAGQPDGTLAG